VVPPSSETPYANKKWVACSDTKVVYNNHETQRMHMYETVHGCGQCDYTKLYTDGRDQQVSDQEFCSIIGRGLVPVFNA